MISVFSAALVKYRSGDAYEPDFVVETDKRMMICEVKARNELTDATVQAKAQAAVKWCQAANRHGVENGGKPWSYALIPDDQVIGSATLEGLVARFGSQERATGT